MHQKRESIGKGKNMNTLTVKDLCKTYIINKRQNNVLKNINMEIREGEMVAVMGPSGSGDRKSVV